MKTDFIQSLSAARKLAVLPFSCQWPANDVDLLKCIFTCSCVRGEGRNRNARVNCACTHTSTSSDCNDTDLLICDDVCRQYLFVGGDHFLLIGSPLPPLPPHTLWRRWWLSIVY